MPARPCPRRCPPTVRGPVQRLSRATLKAVSNRKPILSVLVECRSREEAGASSYTQSHTSTKIKKKKNPQKHKTKQFRLRPQYQSRPAYRDTRGRCVHATAA